MNNAKTANNATMENNPVDLWDAVREANTGNQAALATLRQELTSEKSQKLIDSAGCLAWQLENATLNGMLGEEQEGTKLILRDKLERMRAELGWKTSAKLERILIERVVQNWLYLHLLELSRSQSRVQSLALSKHESSKIEQADRRLHRAIKMLTTVRKMALPIRIDVKADINLKNEKSLPLDRFGALNFN